MINQGKIECKSLLIFGLDVNMEQKELYEVCSEMWNILELELEKEDFESAKMGV